jgi:pyruvate dehydrogenase E2 component (dihydrolipoamide acetyltransferase)
MAVDIKMPKLSDNMEEGTIIRWLKAPGDEVQRGESIAEVETDKADVELEASDAGVLEEIKVAAGASAAVGEVIATLRSSDGRAASRAAEERSDASSRAEKEPAPSREAEGRRTAEKRPAREAGPSRQDEGDARGEREVRASPLASRLADRKGVDLKNLRGSGPAGRIVKRDVEAAGAALESVPASKSGQRRAERVEEPQPEERLGTAIEEPSRMRRTIARRMTEAKQRIPHFYVRTEIDMSEAMRLRESIKKTGAMPRLTVTHLIIKACAVALRRHPRVNASWQNERVVFHEDVNVGIAVAVDDGLLVPVLHQAQHLSLEQVAERAAVLTERARAGKFGGEDLSGGTFSISNVGVVDVDDLVAVINPPQAAILAVGSVKERPIARQGKVSAALTMRATLSCDHRVLNGVEGGEFLADLRSVLENPVALLLA